MSRRMAVGAVIGGWLTGGALATVLLLTCEALDGGEIIDPGTRQGLTLPIFLGMACAGAFCSAAICLVYWYFRGDRP